MKKNLKIVSAAAAALLAVAPVAATAVSTVNAAPVQKATDIGKVPALTNGEEVNVTPHFTVNTSAPNIKAAISVSFDVKYGDTTATSNFKPGVSDVRLYHRTKSNVSGHEWHEITNLSKINDLSAGSTYGVYLSDVGLNFGSQNANKEITLTFPGNDGFAPAHSNTISKSRKVKLDKNGTVTLSEVYLETTAKDFANPAVVSWHDQATGEVVNSGDVTLYAGSDAGRMNVSQVVAAARAKYYAENSVRPQSSTLDYSNNLSDALKAMGVTVDSNGWFTAPKHFSFNLTAKASNNDAQKTLAVSVNVPNGKDISNPSEYDHTVRVWNKKASYIYNANHQKQGFGIMYKIGSGHNVVADANGQPKVYHLNGFDAFKLADGHYKGNYVDVRNFSTTRQNRNVKIVTTRSRVFTNTGRVVGRHNYVNSGVRVKVSGTKTIKGHKMYRIATNRYIKAANVRNA